MEDGLEWQDQADDRPHPGTHAGRPGFIRGAAMAWILLLVAGLFEVVWAYSMKLSNGFTHLTYSVITVVMMMASFGLLSVAMRSLPLGTAYTVWTGIGAVGAFVVGIVFLGEQIGLMRIRAAVLIVSGLVLMKLSAH
jgi:quaternary ammonium compound-resistance protein SugE